MENPELLSLIALAKSKNQKSQTKLINLFWVDVFSFVIMNIPKDIKSTLTKANTDLNHIDYVIFHQANDFMNNHITKKLKLPKEKVPSTIAKFGNTSSVSVPLTIVSELQNVLPKDTKTLLLSSFGVGMSWSTSILQFVDCKISNIIEV